MIRILILFSLLGIYSSCVNEGNAKPILTDNTAPMEEENDKLLRHVVIFKFNDDTAEQDVQRLNDSFVTLKDAIPVVQDFEWGLNDSPEDFHQDFTHCYMLTFESEEDRDSVYTPHPAHQAFVASLGPHLEKVFVVDYWANK